MCLHNRYCMPSKTARKNSWKNVQRKNKIKKKTKLAAIVLGLIILVILIGNLVKLTQTLFSPWKLPENHSKYLWNGEFNLNLVVKKNSSVSVVSYNPREGKLIMLEIPQTVLVEVPGGFGNWQIRSVYELGETSQKGEGASLLKMTIVSFLGIPIDGFLDIGDLDSDLDTEELIELLQKDLIFSLSSLPSVKTDLTLWELIRFKMGISSVRFDKVLKLDLLGVLDKEKLADGTQIYTADSVKLDSLLTPFADPAVKMEHKSIAVFNATEELALAQKVSRVITNLGGNVIITSNASQKWDKSHILGEKSQTLKRLNQVFNFICSAENDCDKIKPEDWDGESRAEINIILGKDITKL